MIHSPPDIMEERILSTIAELGLARRRQIMEKANLSTYTSYTWLRGFMHKGYIRKYIFREKGLGRQTDRYAYILTLKGFEKLKGVTQ